MFYMRNFGHDGPEKFNGVGINGKNSEYHAAMGLTMLSYMTEVIATRKKQFEVYKQQLSDSPVLFQKHQADSDVNCSYFPVIFESEEVALKVMMSLEEQQIFTRRYFYPSLNTLSYVDGTAPISEDIASRILCLPLYNQLSLEDQKVIIKIITRELSK